MNSSQLTSVKIAFWSGVQSLFSKTVWVRIEEPLRPRIVILLVFLSITGVMAWEGWGLVQFVGWILGAFIGWWFLDVDHVVDVLWIKSDNATGREAHQLVANREWQKLFILLFDTRHDRQELVLHSVVFQVLLYVVGIYIVTSGGLFGKGLVLGLLVRMVFEQVRLFVKEGSLGSWLWQVKDALPHNLQGLYLVGAIIVFVWLTLFGL